MNTLLRVTCLVALIAGSAVAQAQQAAKVPRIGFLSGLDLASLGTSRVEAFRKGLKELGYIEGKNIVVEYRWAEGKFDRVPDLVAELNRLKVEVIVTAGPSATRGAKQATATIPIVMAFDSDPVGSGFVATLARPGGNITGLSMIAPEVAGKQLDVLKQIVPRLGRVAVLGDSKEPGNGRTLQEIEDIARTLAVQVHKLDIRAFKDIDEAFHVVRKERPDALIVLSSTIIHVNRAQVAALASKSRLPAMYPYPDQVDAGGLVTYSVNLDDLYRRAATYVHKILNGANPAHLPVEQPFKFDLVINLKAAKQIGLEIPMSMLARADRVIH